MRNKHVYTYNIIIIVQCYLISVKCRLWERRLSRRFFVPRSKLAHLRSRRRQYPSEDSHTNGATGHRRSSYPVAEQKGTHLPSSSSSSSLYNNLPPQPLPVQETMTGRDRTAEFTSVVLSLQSYHVRGSRYCL